MHREPDVRRYPFVGLTFGSKVCVFTFAAAMAKKSH